MDVASSNKAMWQGALWSATITSIVMIVASGFITGKSGLFGSLLASFTIVLFFSVSKLVARLTNKVDPVRTLVIVLISYFTKLLLIAGFLITVMTLTDENSVNRQSFGVSAVFIVLAWLAGEVRTYLKLPLLLPLPSAGKETTREEGKGIRKN
jgi:hypothetical protein